MPYDYLIVGAGLYGATFARLAADRGHRCLVIDKRQHAGGNIYCQQIAGINVHAYGAHIFHTSDRAVWDFARRFVEFNRFTNSPIAIAPDGRVYNLPFNLNTFAQLWGVHTPAEAQAILSQQRAAALASLRSSALREPLPASSSSSSPCPPEPSQPRNLEEQALALVGRDIYELLIKGYTQKQWGRPCSELPAFIIKRLPVRLTFDNNYFTDLYQGIPIGGYNRLIDGLLDGIDVRLGCDFFADRAQLESLAPTIVYTGPIDQFFDYRFGPLEYRTLRFDTQVLDTPNYQGNAVVNYTSASVPYTRVIEHKHFEAFGSAVYDNPLTVVTHEYPAEWSSALREPLPASSSSSSSCSPEPCYPINDARNQSLYSRYRALADSLAPDGTPVRSGSAVSPASLASPASPRVIFGGRLAEYRYLDMAPTIAAAMAHFPPVR